MSIRKKILYLTFIILLCLGLVGCKQKVAKEPSDLLKAVMVGEVYDEQGYDAAMVKLDELFDDRENEFAQAAINVITEKETGVPIYDNLLNKTDNQAQNLQISQSNGVEVTEKEIKVKDGYIYISGSVKNTSQNVIRYYEVATKLYNRNGEVINSDYTNSAQDLEPNESRRFEIMTKGTGKSHTYEVFTDNIKFK